MRHYCELGGDRTMKYRPNYPGTFETLDQARAHVGWHAPRYNQNHKHSGIALFSPNEDAKSTQNDSKQLDNARFDRCYRIAPLQEPLTRSRLSWGTYELGDL